MKKRLVVGIAIATLIGGIPTASFHSSSSEPASGADGWYMVVNGVRTSGNDLPHLFDSGTVTYAPATTRAPVSRIRPQLIDNPAAWSACFGPLFNDKYALATYRGVITMSKDVHLECGPHETKTSGWHHIQASHQSQWQARVDAIPATVAWDDFMADMLAQVMWYPDRYTVIYSGKRCFYSTIEIRKLNGALIYRFQPTVVISTTANRIITAYPSTSQDCSRQAPLA